MYQKRRSCGNKTGRIKFNTAWFVILGFAIVKGILETGVLKMLDIVFRNNLCHMYYNVISFSLCELKF